MPLAKQQQQQSVSNLLFDFSAVGVCLFSVVKWLLFKCCCSLLYSLCWSLSGATQFAHPYSQP